MELLIGAPISNIFKFDILGWEEVLCSDFFSSSCLGFPNPVKPLYPNIDMLLKKFLIINDIEIYDYVNSIWYIFLIIKTSPSYSYLI